MKLKTINSVHNVTTNIVFGAICFSGLIFGLLVFSGNIGRNQSGPWPVSDLSNNQNFGLYMAILIGTANLVLFKKIMSEKELKLKFNSINALTPPPLFNSPKQFEEFQKASESEQKEFLFRTYLFQRYVLNWSLNNSIAIFGLVSAILGAPTYVAYYFVAAALMMQYIMRPRVNDILKDVQARV